MILICYYKNFKIKFLNIWLKFINKLIFLVGNFKKIIVEKFNHKDHILRETLLVYCLYKHIFIF